MQLFEELLAEDVGDLYHGAYRVANSQGRGLRISLSMTEAPALLEIPWELLYDPSEARFLSQSIYTPVVRSLDLKNSARAAQGDASAAGARARQRTRWFPAP